ncbi:MAG: serine hydrolase, partial [Cyanobacteria bacterium]|nr:serine hydrolase [Cyanobacteriota bacterium]
MSNPKLVFRNGQRCVLCVLIAAFSLTTFAGRAKAEIPQGLDEFVTKSLKEYNVPGASVVVIDGDKTYIKGYGVRSVDSGKPVDGDTLFMLASVSKAFTASLVSILVDDGKLSFDDQVVDNFPEFYLNDSYATRMCTARDLLAHRSGLPAFEGDNLEGLGFSREEIIRRIRYIKPACSFREKAGYSNPGIFLAGMLAARLGGASFEDLVKKRIFAPLGMTRSGLSCKDRIDNANVAEAHKPLPEGGSKVVPWDNADPLAPAGGVTSTANDLARWVRMLVDGGSFEGRQIISKKNVDEMWEPAMVSERSFAEMPPIGDNTGFSFGLGWGVYYYQGHKVIEKGGARLGVRSAVVIVPDKKIGIVVLANQNLTVLPEAVRAYLLEKMVAPAGTDVQAAIHKTSEEVSKHFGAEPAPIKAKAPPSLPLEKYVGVYQNELYGDLRVILEGGKLRWEAGPEKVTGSL